MIATGDKDPKYRVLSRTIEEMEKRLKLSKYFLDNYCIVKQK